MACCCFGEEKISRYEAEHAEFAKDLQQLDHLTRHHQGEGRKKVFDQFGHDTLEKDNSDKLASFWPLRRQAAFFSGQSNGKNIASEKFSKTLDKTAINPSEKHTGERVYLAGDSVWLFLPTEQCWVPATVAKRWHKGDLLVEYWGAALGGAFYGGNLRLIGGYDVGKKGEGDLEEGFDYQTGRKSAAMTEASSNSNRPGSKSSDATVIMSLDFNSNSHAVNLMDSAFDNQESDLFDIEVDMSRSKSDDLILWMQTGWGPHEFRHPGEDSEEEGDLDGREGDRDSLSSDLEEGDRWLGGGGRYE